MGHLSCWCHYYSERLKYDDMGNACHAERSEASPFLRLEILRYAQNDNRIHVYFLIAFTTNNLGLRREWEFYKGLIRFYLKHFPFKAEMIKEKQKVDKKVVHRTN